MRIDDHSVSSNACLHARGEIQLPWHLMISSIAMALHSQKLGQTIRSEWPPQVMSTLQWHHHTQTNLLRIAPAIQYYIKPHEEQKQIIQHLNSTVSLNLTQCLSIQS